MVKIRQKLCNEKLDDIPMKVRKEIFKLDIGGKIEKGDTVAITCGSRGISNINIIIKAVVDTLSELGLNSFIVPAMGSHGSATAEGQKEMIAHYGVTEDFIGVPIKSSMDVVEIGETEDGVNVCIDKNAFDADHILVLNRIKLHTDFKGVNESGLMKMMTIGLGKYVGATRYHTAAVDYGMQHMIHTVGRTVLKNAKILCGLGIIENGYDQTADICAFNPDMLEMGEREMLLRANEFFPRLPVENVDILILDVIGKNISGTGMDTNVIGRFYCPVYSKEPESPKIKRIIVSDLTEQSNGNGTGIGLADFCNQRIINKLDKNATYINCLTGMAPEKARIPITYPNDRMSMQSALRTIGLVAPESARVIHAYSTLHMEFLEVSESVAKELELRDDIEILEEANELLFDENDNFIPVNKKF
jgi:hypothetical protein